MQTRQTMQIQIDSETNLVQQHYAVVYTPRRQRSRFPQNCVELFDTAEQAIEAADADAARYAAKVYGPSRSSEGHMLFYLVNWL